MPFRPQAIHFRQLFNREGAYRMWITSRRLWLALVLLGIPLLCKAQTPARTLQEYLSEIIVQANGDQSITIAEWNKRHPGEVLEEPMDKSDPRKAFNLEAWEKRDVKLEGRWCLKSIATIELAGGIHVRRVALFYPPLVEQIYDKPLPPLPMETGEDLRKNGCRLVRILNEFEGVPAPQNFVADLAKQLPGKPEDDPGQFLGITKNEYWSPVWASMKFGDPLAQYYVFARNPKVARPGDHPDFLLEWEWGTTDYGEPSNKTINPEAGQPWLALRAAKFAELPEGPTLDMLSFLAPQVGDTYEQAPLHCEKQLIPVLRKWLDLAQSAKPEQHAAALLLAHEVLGRLWYCQEFSASGDYRSAEDEKADAQDKDALEKDLQELGIKTEQPARLDNEHYAGNLLEEVLKLAQDGRVNELAHIASLDQACRWSYYSDGADCRSIIEEGESFLAHFSEDEWTPTVHLILAEAYALTASNPVEEGFVQTPQPPNPEWEQKAASHYRAWYTNSKNNRERALVWQEIWAIEAGMGPSLMVPSDVRR
ncbi:MAG TPA: hypothetical protein VMW38_05285 [Terriglobia bacterium]|nr:hypothetical protein [Terriglobia bacterium]